MILQITSPSNPRITRIQTLNTARGRKKNNLFLLEGLNLLEALFANGVMPYEIYFQPDMLRRTDRGKALLKRIYTTPALRQEQLIEVNERVIEAIGEVQSSQGVVCLLSLEALAPEKIDARRKPAQRPALLILDDIADPGNMGTILRTALAADVERVLLTTNCVDYYSPKVLRAAAGAHLQLPVEQDLSWEEITGRVAAHCATSGSTSRVLLAEANSEHMYYEEDLTQF